MKKSSKLLAFVIMAVMLFTLIIPASAYAETVTDTANKLDGLSYGVADGVITKDSGVHTLEGIDNKLRFNMKNVPVDIGYFVFSAKIRTDEVDEMIRTMTFNVVAGEGDVEGKITYFAKTSIDSNWKEVIGVIQISEKTATSGKINIGFITSGTKMQVKDAQLRKVSSLDFNNNYMAYVRKDGDKANLYIVGPESSVYFIAASYNGEQLKNVALEKVDLTKVTGNNQIAGDNTQNPVAFAQLPAGDNYKYFIWNTNFSPLHNSFSGLYF